MTGILYRVITRQKMICSGERKLLKTVFPYFKKLIFDNVNKKNPFCYGSSQYN